MNLQSSSIDVIARKLHALAPDTPAITFRRRLQRPSSEDLRALNAIKLELQAQGVSSS